MRFCGFFDVYFYGECIMEKRISSKWVIMIMVTLWVVVIAVADMNWPQHMGPQNALIEAIGNLI